ncbi:unnamed protein product [Timema podura]|uniref:Autophagy-related protein 2 n=1 Tax=Timema podura TaxID=61482 RepID=A0ABN7NTL1_TIMPD|nr:unnamed protein product [Timema podura]
MTMSSSSTPDSKNFDNANTAPVTPSSSSPPSDPLPHSNLSTEANPILFGKLNGCQEVRLRLKQSEVVIGPKVDIEVNLGSLTMFLSARQLHVLLELLHGLATPDLEDTSNVTPRTRCLEKPMDSSDFHRVEQELLHQLQPPPVLRTKGLQNTQGWSTASLDDSDEEFLPMKGGAMIDSMLSSVTSMDGSVLSSVSSVSTSAHSGLAGSFSSQSSPTKQHTRNKSHKGAGVRTLDTDPNAEVSHFHVRLSSVVLVLLHEDILTLCVETDGSSLARSSVQQMKSVAQHFFSEIGLFAVSGYDNKDFIEGKKIFERACQLNHIRLLAAPVIIEGNEKTTSLASSISGRVTAASLELLECLVDKPAAVEVVEEAKFKAYREPTLVEEFEGVGKKKTSQIREGRKQEEKRKKKVRGEAPEDLGTGGSDSKEEKREEERRKRKLEMEKVVSGSRKMLEEENKERSTKEKRRVKEVAKKTILGEEWEKTEKRR